MLYMPKFLLKLAFYFLVGEKKITTEEKMGLVMKNAGVAITVTSLTDFIVFGIGATTVSYNSCKLLVQLGS